MKGVTKVRIEEREKYFVDIEEFIDIEKNPFIAGLLSITLGVFGFHRFYLKRKTTGFILLATSFISVGLDFFFLFVIIFLLSWGEGIYYIITGLQLLKKKYFDKKGTFISKFDEIIPHKKSGESQLEEDEDKEQVKIIDVSNVKPPKINWKKDMTNRHSDQWLRRLEIPYERKVMSVRQVKVETHELYKRLCSYIDAELRNQRTTFNREVKKVEKSPGPYNNLLYTIYCISEGHVTKGYSGDYSYYNPSFSYNILESHLGREIKNKVFKKAQELENNLPFPEEETIKYFDLTDNGVARKWWDLDGKVREKIKFEEDELILLNQTPKRNTVVWENTQSVEQILNLYLLLWKSILDTEKMEKNNQLKQDISSALIKISENTIREVTPSTPTLNIEKENDQLLRILSKEAVDNIDGVIQKYKSHLNPNVIKNIVDEMIEKEPTNWKLKAKNILISDLDTGINDLINYQRDDNFIKIAKNLIKKSKDEEILLLSLYSINRVESLSTRNNQLLNKMIDPTNIKRYEEIVKQDKDISRELLAELLELKNPIRKKIELNLDKVKKSQEQLNETIDIVVDYIEEREGTEDIVKENKISSEKEIDKQELKHKNFLNLILKEEFLDIEKAQKIALDNGSLLNAFISEVNLELYEFIQDQTIIIDNDVIRIDEFYVDMVRELLMNE